MRAATAQASQILERVPRRNPLAVELELRFPVGDEPHPVPQWQPHKLIARERAHAG